jgi:hypothetical protein
MDTLHFYIGTEDKTRLAEKVLGWSIRKYATCNVTITPMIGPDWEIPSDLHSGTGFSQRRFMIPFKRNYEGLAVYVDADQLVLDDVSDLLAYGNRLIDENKKVACTFQPDKFKSTPWPQSSVMVINCAACSDWKLNDMWEMLRSGHDYQSFMHLTWVEPKLEIPAYWNHLNKYEKGVTKLLHYTTEPDQPWYKPSNKLAYLWEDALTNAIKDKAVELEDLTSALRRWGQPTGNSRKSNGLHPHYSRLKEMFK